MSTNTAPAFSIGNGKVITDFGSDDEARSITLQADGKIVVAGFDRGPFVSDFALARYNADGSLDTTFDGDGRVTTDFDSSYDHGYGIAVQPDGRIVVAGYSQFSIGDNRFTLARYNADGSLDTSFGSGGKVGTYTGIIGERGTIALQPDGRIVVAGYGFDGATEDFVVSRYNADGTFDTSFGGDGTVLTDFGTGDEGHGVVLQADGKILVAGERRTETSLGT